jgi:predicted esterase
MNRLFVLILPLLLLGISLVECDSNAPISVAVTKDLVYAKAFKRDRPVELMLDVYAPAEPGEWPIVLYLHDFGETKEGTTLLPQAIAEQGAIVFNIDYPDIDPSVACLNKGKGHRELDEIVACAVRFARVKASDLGSDAPPLAIAGFSWGGGVASHVALMGDTVEARWQEYAAAHDGPPCQCECVVSEGSNDVDALVGIAGSYDAFVGYDGLYGREFLQEKDPELWQMLYSSIGENLDLKIRLLHSETDSTIPYENSVAFETLLAEAGYDVKLIPYTGGHTTPLEPTVQTIMDVLED